MKPLIVLIVVFALAVAGTRIFVGSIDYFFAGRIAMSVMLIFTAIAHFTFAEGMVKMMPRLMPAKKELVFVTGIIEILAAAGLLVPGLVNITAWLLIVFFMLIIPANIKAAMEHINYQKGTNDGPGTRYLWFRVPLQLFFILWVYFSALHLPG